jgi:adenylate cyclase
MLAVERKRATILNADVAGYARMMAEDALATIDSLLDCVQRLSALVRLYGGRVIDATGDNLAAEFRDENAALQCALEMQHELVQRNCGRAPQQHMRFRIGLHCGEVLGVGERVFGDVVNVAARLQSSADPDALVVSHALAERANASLLTGAVERGAQHFKHIPYAVSSLSLLTQAD